MAMGMTAPFFNKNWEKPIGFMPILPFWGGLSYLHPIGYLYAQKFEGRFDDLLYLTGQLYPKGPFLYICLPQDWHLLVKGIEFLDQVKGIIGDQGRAVVFRGQLQCFRKKLQLLQQLLFLVVQFQVQGHCFEWQSPGLSEDGLDPRMGILNKGSRIS